MLLLGCFFFEKNQHLIAGESPRKSSELTLTLDQFDANLTQDYCYGNRQSEQDFRRFLQCIELINMALVIGGNQQFYFPEKFASSDLDLSIPIEKTPTEIDGSFAIYPKDGNITARCEASRGELACLELTFQGMFETLKEHFFDGNSPKADLKSRWKLLKEGLKDVISKGDDTETEIVLKLTNQAIGIIDPYAGISLTKDFLKGSHSADKNTKGRLQQQIDPPFFLSEVYQDTDGQLNAVLSIHEFLSHEDFFCSKDHEDHQSPLESILESLVEGSQQKLEKLDHAFYSSSVTLNGNKISRLIVDLRNNRGGNRVNVKCLIESLLPKEYMFQSFHELFPNEEFKKYIDKLEKSSSFSGSVGNDSSLHIPTHTGIEHLVVLVNQKTASGAELFAGAVKGGFGYVVGETTRGKGTGAAIIPFEDAESIGLNDADPILLNLSDHQKQQLMFQKTVYQFFLYTATGVKWSPFRIGVEPDFQYVSRALGDGDEGEWREPHTMATVYDPPFITLPFPSSEDRRPLKEIRDCLNSPNSIWQSKNHLLATIRTI
jgi:hypothetical protein